MVALWGIYSSAMAGITYYGYMTLTHDPTIFVSFGILHHLMLAILRWMR